MIPDHETGGIAIKAGNDLGDIPTSKGMTPSQELVFWLMLEDYCERQLSDARIRARDHEQGRSGS